MLRLGPRNHLLLLPYFLLHLPWVQIPVIIPPLFPVTCHGVYTQIPFTCLCTIRSDPNITMPTAPCVFTTQTPTPLLSIHKPQHPSRCARVMLPTSESSCLCFSICHVVLDLYCSSVTKSCQTLCDPVNCSTPGLPVSHHLP